MKQILGRAAMALTLCFVPGAWAAPWTVDPAQSRLTFTGRDSGGEFTGSFATWSAEIDFDPAHLETTSIRILVDTGSADAKDDMRNRQMPGQDWFNVAMFPKAEFRSTRVVRLADGTYAAEGTLRIRDFEKPLRLPFALAIAGSTARAEGAVVVKRTDFGLGMDRGPDWVGLEVKIAFALTASVAPH
jgi:polyisoprenoid-binding protein YceI